MVQYNLMYEFEINMLKSVKIYEYLLTNIQDNFEINAVDIIYYFCGGFIIYIPTLTHAFLLTSIDAVQTFYY